MAHPQLKVNLGPRVLSYSSLRSVDTGRREPWERGWLKVSYLTERSERVNRTRFTIPGNAVFSLRDHHLRPCRCFLEKPNCWIMPRTRVHTSRILYRTQKGRHTCFTYEWTLKQTLPRGPTWRDAFACGILTREVFIKAHGDFGSRKITF